jgi:CBS domain-containing protein
MKVKDVMTPEPACCYPETGLKEVARLMIERDCGEIPVIDKKTNKVIGVITDRDITCRCVAEGKNPEKTQAKDCMSAGVITCSPETSIDDCCAAMEANQVRRMPVANEWGLCGIISQADIAQAAPKQQVISLLQHVSRPTQSASYTGGGR